MWEYSAGSVQRRPAAEHSVCRSGHGRQAVAMRGYSRCGRVSAARLQLVQLAAALPGRAASESAQTCASRRRPSPPQTPLQPKRPTMDEPSPCGAQTNTPTHPSERSDGRCGATRADGSKALLRRCHDGTHTVRSHSGSPVRPQCSGPSALRRTVHCAALRCAVGSARCHCALLRSSAP